MMEKLQGGEQQFVLKGAITYCVDKDHMESMDQGYVVCDRGICRGAFREVPEEYAAFPVNDLG